MISNLGGLNAILTGGSRGIGPFIGAALARAGVRLALAARSADALQTVARDLGQLGVLVIALPTDLASAEARELLVERASAVLGPIDLLINNASVAQALPFVEQTEADMARMLDVNLVAALHLARLVLPGMLQRRRGHIVTIGALNGKHGAPFFATHSASKAALIAWTSGLRAELDGTGVSASIVCPGLVGGAGWWAERRLPVPWILGESSPAQVAAAVLRAIRYDHAEVLINPMPIRPALALHALGPALMSRLVDKLGLVDLVRRMIAL